ncbi:hypothetical protein ACFL59_04770 [Planctomycetota bacterium]
MTQTEQGGFARAAQALLISRAPSPAPPRLVVGLCCLALVAVETGCAQHLVVADQDNRTYRPAEVTVYVKPTTGEPIEGLEVEILDDCGELVCRVLTESQPRRIVGLPSGTYLLRVHAESIGAGTLDTSFTIRPGQSLAITYDDNADARRAWKRFGTGATKTLEITGKVLVVTAVVAARVAIVVARCCCRH